MPSDEVKARLVELTSELDGLTGGSPDIGTAEEIAAEALGIAAGLFDAVTVLQADNPAPTVIVVEDNNDSADVFAFGDVTYHLTSAWPVNKHAEDLETYDDWAVSIDELKTLAAQLGGDDHPAVKYFDDMLRLFAHNRAWEHMNHNIPGATGVFAAAHRDIADKYPNLAFALLDEDAEPEHEHLKDEAADLTNGYTDRELRMAFDLFRDRANGWKWPVDVTFERLLPEERALMDFAIMFYTGSIPEIIGNGVTEPVQFLAAGYYEAIGS